MTENNVAPVEEQETEGTDEPTKGILERTWDFLASVPSATVLIFVIAIASIAGSLIPQEGMYSDWRPPQDFYPAKYGPFWGALLFKTGMTRMYTSWWFLTLLFTFGASLVVCSLERFIPLWKAVQRPNTEPPASFVKHLKHRFEVVATGENPLAALAAQLKAKRYTVILKGDRLYADKGRWGRWGPYITHIGLLLILIGAMLKAVPGAYFEQSIWVRDGATVKVPGTNWYILSEQFVVDYYDNGQPKSYTTHAVVIEDGQPVKETTITMNEPLWHNWVELYQSSYRQEFGKATVALMERNSSTILGTFEVDLIQPDQVYQVGGYEITVKDYYPDFGLDEKGRPTSKSSEAVNPGLVFNLKGPDGKTFINWYFPLYPEMEFDPNTPVRLMTADLGISSTTGLKVKKDLGIPVIYGGLLIVTLGVCFTFYMAHRRYWALVDGARVAVGGWTNRNHSTLRNEMAALATLLDPTTNPSADPMEGEER